jgi:hypothetical protein
LLSIIIDIKDITLRVGATPTGNRDAIIHGCPSEPSYH